MTKSIHLIIKNSIFATAIAIMFIVTPVLAVSTASLVPTCVASVTPAYIASNQNAILRWDASEGAIFTSIDNGIGSVAVDGVLTISPNESTIYTIKTWNSQGEGNTCTTTLIVDGKPVSATIDGQPTVTLQTIAIHPAATQVVLSNVPYTGVAQSALYTFFLLTLVLTATYAWQKRGELFTA